MIVVVTNCTNRKRSQPTAQLQARSLAPGDARSVAAEWWSRIEQARIRVAAQDLYIGRSFGEAVRSAALCGGGLWIVSAGLGLVDAAHAAPAYSLTISPRSEDSILDKANCTPHGWWRALQVAAGSQTWPMVDRLLVALSGPYLAMVGPELAEWSGDRLDRLRIFSGAPPEVIEPVLRGQLMPYDNRFDAHGGPNPGTKSDFAQRALRHFVETTMIQAPDATAEEHGAMVEAALSSLTAREPQHRRQLDDEGIMSLIRRHRGAVGGRSGAMLRYLRDELDIACEQGRFSALFKLASAGGQRL